SVTAGEVRPSADERARATLLVCVSMGIQLLEPYLVPDVPPEQRTAALVDSLAGAAVELYTHGLFTTTEYLDAFRRRDESAPPGRNPTHTARKTTPFQKRSGRPASRRRTPQENDTP